MNRRTTHLDWRKFYSREEHPSLCANKGLLERFREWCSLDCEWSWMKYGWALSIKSAQKRSTNTCCLCSVFCRSLHTSLCFRKDLSFSRVNNTTFLLEAKANFPQERQGITLASTIKTTGSFNTWGPSDPQLSYAPNTFSPLLASSAQPNTSYDLVFTPTK